MKHLVGLLVFVLTLFSCSTYNDDEIGSFDKQIKDHLSKKGIECKRSSSGLYYKIIEPGEGVQIKYTDRVSFTYKGEFLNGKVFDHEKKPVEFEVRQLIGAWKEIMVELRPGGKAFLVAPPQLGYGDRQLDDIPANSILVYNLEVHDVK
jgi:FKBP-type peptidyl-prolyl cis-trans isomerase FkpA